MFKRILIPLNPTDEDMSALEAAIRLATRFRAELVGIYIEDTELMRLAGLPFAREIAHLSAVTRQLNPAGMARALRVRAEIVQSKLQQRAARAQVSWSFLVLQGDLLPEQLIVSPASDLLIIEAGSRYRRRMQGPGPSARRIFMHASCTVWLRRAHANSDTPVIALVDEPGMSERVLVVAGQFARRDGKHLIVMAPAADGTEYNRLANQSRDILGAEGVEADFQRLERDAPTEVIRAVRAAQGKLLVIARSSPLASGEPFQQLLDGLPCEVMLVG